MIGLILLNVFWLLVAWLMFRMGERTGRNKLSTTERLMVEAMRTQAMMDEMTGVPSWANGETDIVRIASNPSGHERVDPSTNRAKYLDAHREAGELREKNAILNESVNTLRGVLKTTEEHLNGLRELVREQNDADRLIELLRETLTVKGEQKDENDH
jgi:hypothetical protein